MKFLILNTDYHDFLSWLYGQQPGLEKQPYEEQMRVRAKSLFGVADFYSRNLHKLGHEAWDIHANNEFMQKAWAREHGLRVERQIGFGLSEPYVLIQTRVRQVVVRSRDVVPKDELIRALVERVKVVMLSFNTLRRFDSFSQFDPSLKAVHYACRSFVEQACLIHFARRCVFFTEGDFGSHIYVPPFMGKDVVAIAPRSVYGLGTTPIDFWNRNVFRFGGRIIPRVSEEVCATRQSMVDMVDDVLSR